jgi:hypothetical protein
MFFIPFIFVNKHQLDNRANTSFFRLYGMRGAEIEYEMQISFIELKSIESAF